MKKASVGFPTITAARTAIQEIVHKYGLNEQFYHPLLQRLFFEQCYWREPPGPTLERFRWTPNILPYGATTERWFQGYSDEIGWKKPGVTGWCNISWNKAVALYKFTIKQELKEVAQYRAGVHKGCHHEKFYCCEYPGCNARTEHVHHTKPMKQIFAEAYALLSDIDIADIQAQHTQWLRHDPFMLPEEHKFIRYIDAQHGVGSMQSLCVAHHYLVEGKQKRTLAVEVGVGDNYGEAK